MMKWGHESRTTGSGARSRPRYRQIRRMGRRRRRGRREGGRARPGGRAGTGPEDLPARPRPREDRRRLPKIVGTKQQKSTTMWMTMLMGMKKRRKRKRRG
jgi:hypothetical protein